jgi:arabinofuranan 3-O-arabinosyltransferase
VVRVSAAAASYLTVAENFNAGWQATLHGRVLKPVQLDGWEQAWLLPAGSAGRVTLSYRPDGPFRLSVFGGLGALLAIMIIAWAPWRRRSPEPAGPEGTAATRPGAAPAAAGRQDGSGEQAWPAIWGIQAPVAVTGLALAAFAGLWIGGYPAALLIPAGTAAFLAAAESSDRSELARWLASPWLAAGLLAAASVCVALGSRLTGGAFTGLSLALPQLLCFGVVARLAAALLGEFRAADRTEAAQPGAAEAARPSAG